MGSDQESTWQCRMHKRHRFHPWVGKIPWIRKWQPTPVFFPEKSHGKKILLGYSPQKFPGDSDGKESTCNAGNRDLILGLRRFPRGGHSSLLQYSCLENSMGRGAWQAIAHRFAESGMTERLITCMFKIPGLKKDLFKRRSSPLSRQEALLV